MSAEFNTTLSLDQADHMSENVVATFALPFRIAENFVVNGHAVAVPMVTEDETVVRSCDFSAALARLGGGFLTGSTDPVMIGQIQILDVPDLRQAHQNIEAAAGEMLDWLNRGNPATISQHSRAVGLEVREVPVTEAEARRVMEQYSLPVLRDAAPVMLVVHVLYDCGNAMGANLVNTACEALAPRIEMLSGGRVNLLILSNLADRRRAWARCTIPAGVLEPLQPTIRVSQRMCEASRLCELDASFAAAHNQAVMCGIDAVAIATGNDWRAVEAGAHAYTAREGIYRSLAQWRIDALGSITGEIELPLSVGIVGGATRVHRGAQAALQMLGVKTARELAEIMACVGLAQSLAFLYEHIDK